MLKNLGAPPWLCYIRICVIMTDVCYKETGLNLVFLGKNCLNINNGTFQIDCISEYPQITFEFHMNMTKAIVLAL